MSVVLPIRERRAAVRADVSLDAYVTEVPAAGAYPGDEELLVPLYGLIVNLSGTGMLIRTEEPLCPGREVRVVTRAEGHRLCLEGYVVRTLHLPFQRGAVVAIELFDLEPVERALIAGVVDAHRADPVLN